MILQPIIEPTIALGVIQKDTRVGFGCLELLRTWGTRVKVAQELGLNYKVSIIDETTAFENGSLLGFSEQDITESYEAMRLYTELSGVPQESLSITPFAHQAHLYRQLESPDEMLLNTYQDRLKNNIARTSYEINEGTLSLNAIRVVALQRLRSGHPFRFVNENRDFSYLDQFSPKDIHQTIEVSESFFSSLSMRSAIKSRITELAITDDYPELFPGSLVQRCGITKSADRLSIRGNFKAHNGQQVTPGYGIPLYSSTDHDFLGLMSYGQALDENSILSGPNGLPIAALANESD